MPVFVACPQCSVTLNVPETFLGKKVRCATCATVFEAQVRQPAATPTPGVDILATAPANLPTIPVNEPPQPSRRERTFDEEEFPDYDERYDREERRRRRKRRRDLMPHHGVPILLFGILGVILTLIGAVCCGVFGAPIGIIMGSVSAIWGTVDLGNMRRGDMDPDGETMTRTGQIMGFVGIGLSLLCLLLCGAFAVLSLSSNRYRGW
jgi:hypothetical protein